MHVLPSLLSHLLAQKVWSGLVATLNRPCCHVMSSFLLVLNQRWQLLKERKRKREKEESEILDEKKIQAWNKPGQVIEQAVESNSVSSHSTAIANPTGPFFQCLITSKYIDQQICNT